MHVLNLCVFFYRGYPWMLVNFSAHTYIKLFWSGRGFNSENWCLGDAQTVRRTFYEINVYKQEENHKRTQKYKNKCLQIQGRGEKQAGEVWQYIRSDETKID